ncbi:hypothetical protein [Virgibacillus pantothenticus]|nr:hypothetical protein [Virgibacillus pantothenticus]
MKLFQKDVLPTSVIGGFGVFINRNFLGLSTAPDPEERLTAASLSLG